MAGGWRRTAAGLALALWAGAAAAQVEIRRLPDGAPIDGVAGLVELARAHDLVVLGELHDNPAHHAFQAELAAALSPPGIALEMLPRAAEAAAVRLREAEAGGAEAPAALREEARAEDWAAWAGVLDAAPEAVAIGAGVAREDLRRAMAEGAAAAFGPEAARFGLDAPLPEGQRLAQEAEIFEAHCGALPREMIPGMAEAQRLRDAAFAEALLRAHAAGPGPALLVTGNGHARRDRGVPLHLAAAEPELRVLAVLTVERLPGDGDWRDALARWVPEGEAPPFDVLVVTPPHDRGDPCDAFRPKGG